MAEVFDVRRIHLDQRYANEPIIRGLCYNAYIGNDTSICRVLGRYKMFVDTSDKGLSPHLLLDGYWEIWITEAMVSAVRAGMTVIDAGANLGYFTVLMADLCGPAGKVIAFEPNNAMASRLRRTIDLNGYSDRVTVYELALDAQIGMGSLVVPAGEPKNGHLCQIDDDSSGLPVGSIRMDSIPGALDADFIKIDVEGAEERVWAGMTDILARRRSLTIFLEFNLMRYSDPEKFLREILSHGFTLGIITTETGILPISLEEVVGGPENVDQNLVFTR